MKIASVKGFHDILPIESGLWAAMEEHARRVFAAYDFREIGIPIAERTDLFRRSLGAATDIVEKEMYTFQDRDETWLTLRPEGTASVVRSFIEHSMHVETPLARLFYRGPMFRRERPQKGRLRQFNQIGAEVFGREDPGADAEILFLLYDLLAALGVSGAQIGVNTLGCRDCRGPYRELLVRWAEERRALLCEDCKRRIEQNPLRVLDCKQEGCRAMRDTAPRMIDHTCEPCRAHFARVLELVHGEGFEPELQPYMVRGLDYYCRTAFEVTAPGLGSQNAIGGGGRYDGLVKDLGGPDVPGIGFAIGLERIAMVLAAAGTTVEERPEFAVLPLGVPAEPAAMRIAHTLRREGARVSLAPGHKSLKSQMRHADKAGARFALLLGESELAAGKLTVRDLAERRDFPCGVDLGCTLTELRAALSAG